MEHHYIIALNKCNSRTAAIKLMGVLDNDKKSIKLRANSLLKSNKESVTLNNMLHDMRKEVNKLTQIRNIITLRIKELGAQEKVANRLTCDKQYDFADHFVQAAAGVLNKRTFDKIKAIANGASNQSKKPT